MKKFYLYSTIFLFLVIGFKTFSADNIINSIQVEGTQRIDIETVVSYSEASTGDIYTEDLGNLILKRLFETNLFSNIQISYSENTLKIILKLTSKFDNFLVNFSMKIARNGAWDFAVSIVNKPPEVLKELIEARDQKTSQQAKIITNPGIVAGTVFGIIRLGERGSVTEKIEKLIA